MVRCGVDFSLDGEEPGTCVVDEGLLERDTSLMSRMVTVPYEVVGPRVLTCGRETGLLCL